MTRILYRHKWEKIFEADRDFFLSLSDPYTNWENQRMREILAEHYFSNGLIVLYSEQDRSLWEKFFVASIGIVSRSIEENKFQTGFSAKEFPGNRARGLRVKTYAQFLISGHLDSSSLDLAGADFMDSYHNMSTDDSSSALGESTYLSALRLFLITNDLTICQSLLDEKRDLFWHEQEHKILKRLVDCLQNDNSITDSVLEDDYFGFFDEVRDPEYSPEFYLEKEIVSFELSLIACIYFGLDSGELRSSVVNLVSS